VMLRWAKSDQSRYTLFYTFSRALSQYSVIGIPSHPVAQDAARRGLFLRLARSSDRVLDASVGHPGARQSAA
jgi:hypothetical protein